MQTIFKKRSANIIFFLGIILLFSLVSFIAANTAFMISDEIYSGISIGDIMVGGLTRDKALATVNGAFAERTKKPPIVLKYQNQAWTVPAQDIGLSIDAENLVRQAYNIGREGNIMRQMRERYIAINHGYPLPLKMVYQEEKLSDLLSNIAQMINREPHEAALLQQGSGVRIIPETVGRKVDIEATMDKIKTQLNARMPVSIDIVVNEQVPAIKSKDFSNIDGVIASYTTLFDAGNSNRTQNISLAARSIDRVLVRPSEIVSFNKLVGLRLAEYGYKEAPVFIDGKLVPDWGGGVCQVSSTLYNAVLLADLEIEERSSHFRPPGYVPIGQDATVADNLIDFKFKNTLPGNIYISTEVLEGKMTVYVFGKRSPNRPDIQIVATDKQIIEPNTIVKQDAKLELGKEVVESEGQKGFIITTYRIKSINGREIGREYLATDEFAPEDRVVRVGSKTDGRQSGK